MLVPSSGASARLLSRSPRRSPPRSGAVWVPAFGSSLRLSPGCARAGAAAGVGSRVTQPMPGNQASTQECASRSRTTYSFSFSSNAPVVKPGGDAGGDAAHPQQQRLGAGVLLAEADLGVEEEAVERPGRRRRALGVGEAGVEVALDRRDVGVRRVGLGLERARQPPRARELAPAQQRPRLLAARRRTARSAASRRRPRRGSRRGRAGGRPAGRPRGARGRTATGSRAASPRRTCRRRGAGARPAAACRRRPSRRRRGRAASSRCRCRRRSGTRPRP